ncbi:MAG: 50S ribosomal protein L18e [Candidatus Methanofastidiosia archaeon]
MRKLKKTNPNLVKLIEDLMNFGYKNKSMIWVYIAKRLAKPSRRMPEVNISKLNRFTKEGEIVLIPGKVLGSGNLDHSLTVSAFKFSKNAEKKIKEKGKIVEIPELMKKNPKGTHVKVMV